MGLFSITGKEVMCWAIIFGISLLLLGRGVVFAQRQTIDERLIRLEEGQKAITQRIDGLRDELKGDISDLRDELKGDISELRGIILAGFGVLFAGMFSLVGFVIWDRRTALSPAIKRSRELEEREERIERALREFAEAEPRLAEVLRRVGLL